MKSFFILIIICLNLLCLKSQTLEETPILYNFTGIVNSNDTIIAYGSAGSMFVSYDEGNSWFEKRAFKNGKIVNLFFENNRILAINDVGLFASSNDGAKSWNTIASIKGDTILAVLKHNSGYLLRGANGLINVSIDLQNKYEYELKSPRLDPYFNYYDLKLSMSTKNDTLIVMDSANRVFFFDNKLKLLRNLELDKITNGVHISHNYWIEKESNNYFIQIRDSIFQTKDFIDYKKYSKQKFKIIDKKKYSMLYSNASRELYFRLTNQSIPEKSVYEVEARQKFNELSVYIYDYTVIKNRLFIVGSDKLIYTAKLGDTNLEMINDANGFNREANVFQISDSIIYIYNKLNAIQLNKNSNMSAPVLDTLNEQAYNLIKYSLSNLLFAHFDQLQNTLLAYGNTSSSTEGFFISKDFGKSYQFTEVPRDLTYTINPYSFYNNNIIITENIFYKKDRVDIWTLDKDFNLINRFIDSLKIAKYVFSKDTNNYFLLSYNTVEKRHQFINTENRGKDWEIIKDYRNEEEYLYHKDFYNPDKTMSAFWMYNPKDSTNTLEILNPMKKSLKTLFKYKIKNPEYQEEKLKNSVDFYKDEFYFSANDTLYIARNLDSPDTWQRHHLADNGRIKKTLKVFNDRLFVRFQSDSLDDNIYWLRFKEKKEDTVKVEEKAIISITDIDFNEQQIQTFSTNLIEVSNLSDKNLDLEIYAYQLPDTNIFKPVLINADSTKPYILSQNAKQGMFVSFHPKDTVEYLDSIVVYSNGKLGKNVAYLRGKGIDTIKSDIRVEIIEENPYLYIGNPFPQPTKSEIKAKIYSDSKYNLSIDKIKIVDINANVLIQSDKLEFQYLNDYSAYLSWDCTSLPSGIYFIQIQLANTYKLIKILKE